jgi:glycosyltransferase involved in cell wall biosynthesis
MASTHPDRCPHCGEQLAGRTERFQEARLSVLMPAYNERATLRDILERVEEIDIPKEIVIVDDGSTDGTRDLLEKIARETEDRAPFDNNLRVFLQDENRGKGAALRRAVREARGDVLIVQDADMEYDPQDYRQLLRPILTDRADVVYGSRFMGGEAHRVLYFWHYVGNKLITLLSNMFTNLNLSDIETCYKVFRAEVIKDLPLEQDGFGFEVEVTSKIAKRDYRVYEVGISYFGRTYEEGKKITWRDGLRALYLIGRYH